jgi:site-specific recombinase XerD
MYLAQRRGEVAESTVQSHHYRLEPFVRWCESTDLTNLNERTARRLHEYRLHIGREQACSRIVRSTDGST